MNSTPGAPDGVVQGPAPAPGVDTFCKRETTGETYDMTTIPTLAEMQRLSLVNGTLSLAQWLNRRSTELAGEVDIIVKMTAETPEHLATLLTTCFEFFTFDAEAMLLSMDVPGTGGAIRVVIDVHALDAADVRAVVSDTEPEF